MRALSLHNSFGSVHNWQRKSKTHLQRALRGVHLLLVWIDRNGFSVCI